MALKEAPNTKHPMVPNRETDAGEPAIVLYKALVRARSSGGETRHFRSRLWQHSCQPRSIRHADR